MEGVHLSFRTEGTGSTKEQCYTRSICETVAEDARRGGPKFPNRPYPDSF
jgi:hypothetical protein